MATNMMVSQTTEKQKAALASMVLQSYVEPMELYLINKQMQLIATLSGEEPETLDEKDLALAKAWKKIIELEAEQLYLAVLKYYKDKETAHGE